MYMFPAIYVPSLDHLKVSFASHQYPTFGVLCQEFWIEVVEGDFIAYRTRFCEYGGGNCVGVFGYLKAEVRDGGWEEC